MIQEERCSNGRLPGLWMHREQILGMMVVWKCFRGSGRVRGLDLVRAEGKVGLEAGGRREPRAGA